MTTRPDGPLPPPAPRAAYVPLGERAPVSVRRAACLRARLHASTCASCAQACPVGALAWDGDRATLAAGCTGCGRCQAACPTGAMQVAGFDIDVESLAPRGPDLVIECARFAAPSAGHRLRVPCLGGLSAADLLWLAAAVPERAVVLADRDACRDCDSGGTPHAASDAVASAAELLRDCGVPGERRPRIERLAAAAPAGADDPLQSSGRARRGFFAALSQPSACPTPTTAARPAPRQRLLDAATAMAQRHRRELPASLFHRIEVAPSCRGHRVCATTCPTGALVRYRDDAGGRMGIAFDARQCIGCGQCATACPEQALSVHPATASAALHKRPLTGFAQKDCADCGTRFSAAASVPETRCERCRRSAQLARSAFTTLFSARP